MNAHKVSMIEFVIGNVKTNQLDVAIDTIQKSSAQSLRINTTAREGIAYYELLTVAGAKVTKDDTGETWSGSQPLRILAAFGICNARSKGDCNAETGWRHTGKSREHGTRLNRSLPQYFADLSKWFLRDDESKLKACRCGCDVYAVTLRGGKTEVRAAISAAIEAATKPVDKPKGTGKGNARKATTKRTEARETPSLPAQGESANLPAGMELGKANPIS